MAEFSVEIEWDDVNGPDEMSWVKKIWDYMHAEPASRAEVDDYSKKLSYLRRTSSNFEALGFVVAIEADRLKVQSFPDRSATSSNADGDVIQAANFIAAFLERWRPEHAVKMAWAQADTAGRLRRAVTLIGPNGITLQKRAPAQATQRVKRAT